MPARSYQASPELVARAVMHKVRPALARASFRYFVPATMRNYQMARHHKLIMEALQLVEQGVIKRLVISMPPRHGKSELVSVRFPAFYLGRHPDHDIIHVSYGSDLSNDFSRRVRALVRDDLTYASLFSNVSLDAERQRVNDWRLANGGGFRSVGTGGGISGHGADLMIIDDPHKEGEITPTVLRQVYEWYTTGARTRLMPGGKIIICMTRWDLLDLVGQVLRAADSDPNADQWWILNLPGIAEENDPLGRAPGEALWPEWYPRESLLAVKALSDVHFQALYQQNPRALNVQMFDPDAWRRVQRVRVAGDRPAWCFDLALGEDDTADYTCWARFYYDKDTLGISHLFRERMTWPEAKHAIEGLFKLFPNDDFVFPRQTFELMAVQALRYDNPGMRLHQVGFPAHSDKRSRAQVFADRLSRRKVVIQECDLADIWIQEHSDFPAEHDDCVDVGSVATHWFGLQHEFKAAIVDAEAMARSRAREEASRQATLERIGA